MEITDGAKLSGIMSCVKVANNFNPQSKTPSTVTLLTRDNKNTEERKTLKHIRKIPHIKISKNNLHMNDTNIDTYNPVFRTCWKNTS
jgi:hypothetical protein